MANTSLLLPLPEGRNAHKGTLISRQAAEDLAGAVAPVDGAPVVPVAPAAGGDDDDDDDDDSDEFDLGDDDDSAEDDDDDADDDDDDEEDIIGKCSSAVLSD